MELRKEEERNNKRLTHWLEHTQIKAEKEWKLKRMKE